MIHYHFLFLLLLLFVLLPFVIIIIHNNRLISLLFVIHIIFSIYDTFISQAHGVCSQSHWMKCGRQTPAGKSPFDAHKPFRINKSHFIIIYLLLL